MAFLALGSTDSNNSSTQTSNDDIRTAPNVKQETTRESTGANLRSAPVSPLGPNDLDSEVERILADRTIEYEKKLEAWNKTNASQNAAEKEKSSLEDKIRSLESSKPVPPVYKEREWTSIDGKHRTIAALEMTDGVAATLRKPNGITVTIPKEKLIEEDRSYLLLAFGEFDTFRNRTVLWEDSKKLIEEQRSTIASRISTSRLTKPVLPDKQSILAELATKQKDIQKQERLAREEEDRKASEIRAEKSRLATEKRHEEMRNAAVESARKAEEEYEEGGLVLLRKTVEGKATEFGGEITGEVISRRKSKLNYAQIQFNLYDESGAQVGTALANINGLEPGVRWKFIATSFGTKFSKYKINKLSGF